MFRAAFLLKSQGFTAIVMLHGGHLVSWKSPSGEELIFLSEKAIFKPPKVMMLSAQHMLNNDM